MCDFKLFTAYNLIHKIEEVGIQNLQMQGGSQFLRPLSVFKKTIYFVLTMNDNNLLLLGLTVDEGCPVYIKKNLVIGKLYPFIRSFKDFNPNKPIFPLNDPYSIPHNFFTNGNTYFDVQFSAIVGPNGSGKSSLIDIIIRILNNLSFFIGEAYKHVHSFTPISSLKATLYYSIGTTLYRLTQKGLNNKHPEKLIDLRLEKFSKGSWTNLKLTKKNLGSLFFYAVFLNYSIHAFNTADYMEEMDTDLPYFLNRGHWLNSCFYKNDGYQAPIVLNPKRNNGVIDINNENHLAKSRLISLIFKSGAKKDSSFTYINNHSKISAIRISTDKDSVKKKLDKVWKLWKNRKYGYNEEVQTFIYSCIRDFWEKKYKFKKLSDEDTLYNLAMDYLVYKTLSIVLTYDTFDKFDALTPEYNISISESWKQEINELLDEIDKEPSHITFRLRQTLAFLHFRHYQVEEGEEKVIRVSEFSDSLINQLYYKEWEMAELAPPPIFKSEILIKNDESGEEYPISKISSGERQLAYVVSTILYHLRNIDSVRQSPRRIKYQHLCIFLDEIELYFHPGYQRLLIHQILEALKSFNLPDIKSLHFIVITHSPFILSDIPKSNVLFLRDALPVFEMQENTFASNIHSILRNGFFMEDGTMGAFAHSKVNNLFRQLYENNLTPNLKEEILLVSEPVIRSQLLKIYNELNPPTENSRLLHHLYNEIERLKAEVENLKK